MTSERLALLFNADAGASGMLRSAINGLPNTKVITEVSDQSSLSDALRRLTVHVVVFHLDPRPDEHIAMIETIAAQFPKTPIIAISERTEPVTIINAMRAGCQQFVFKPIDRADLARAVDRVVVQHAELTPVGRRLCVLGGSGGVGSTTIACNLAMEIAHVTRQTCALVDLQLELGDVASNFDCTPTHTIASLCEVEGEIDRALLETAVVQLPCGVAVLARPNTIEEAGLVTADRAASILRLVSTFYHSVVIDTPRSLDRLTLGALEQADAVLLVLQLIVPSVRNAMRLYRTLLNYGMPDDRIHIIVNRFKKNVGRIAPEDVEKQFGKKVYGVIPNDYQCVTSSLDFGHPLMADSPDSPVRTAIRELATRLLGQPDEPPPGKQKEKERSGGFLTRIFKS